MTAKELLELLEAFTAEQLALPVVITHDCWQWELTEQEAPKLALWSAQGIGTPRTAEQLEADQSYGCSISETNPCIAIGYL